MSLRSTSRSLLAAGIAASLLASAPALARTADEGVRTSSLAGTASPRQDLRGEHARDAARPSGGPNRGVPPVYWSYGYEAPKPSPNPVSAPAQKPTNDDDLWLILGIALGATGIVAGSAVAVSRRSRVRVPA